MVEAAMSPQQARAAIDVGIEVAQLLVGRGARCLLTGDMGIANTTASAALIAAFTGADPETVTGRGSGVHRACTGRGSGDGATAHPASWVDDDDYSQESSHEQQDSRGDRMSGIISNGGDDGGFMGKFDM